MSDNYLEKAFPFLSKMEPTRQAQFKTYFKNAPIWLIDSFTIEKMEKGKTFIQEGTPADMVYFILDGLSKATDYRMYGIKFDFILFSDIYAYGGLEVLMDLDLYRASLETVTECTVLKIPRPLFVRWLMTDISALKHEAKLMGEYMMEQARSARALMFLQGTDRLELLFINRYKKFAMDGVLNLENDRQELSDYTGLSVKTITRSLKKLEDDGMITKQKNRILIDENQYEKIKEALSKILAEDE